MRRLLVALLGLIVPLGSSACAAKAASFATIPICGNSVAIPDVLPPSGSGPVVLMAAPCLLRDDGTSVIPEDYRRYVLLQTSRPLDGVWIPYDENTTEAMQADYRRLWNTGRLSDLTFTVTEYAFPNGTIGKIVTYTLKER